MTVDISDHIEDLPETDVRVWQRDSACFEIGAKAWEELSPFKKLDACDRCQTLTQCTEYTQAEISEFGERAVANSVWAGHLYTASGVPYRPHIRTAMHPRDVNRRETLRKKREQMLQLVRDLRATGDSWASVRYKVRPEQSLSAFYQMLREHAPDLIDEDLRLLVREARRREREAAA